MDVLKLAYRRVAVDVVRFGHEDIGHDVALEMCRFESHRIESERASIPA